jgi:O-methyltransferase involved in polyketide biosynthesis
MATTDNIQLTGEKETLFIPLAGKALDYRSKHSVLNDSKANEIVAKVGIDFTKHKSVGAKIGARTLAIRAKQYDEWTKDFITKNKNAVVVHLGCGLDARITRVQPPSSIAWFDVDYPEVISLRKEFYPETKEYKMIASSVTAHNWLETIPADRPAFIIAEGVLEYLPEEEVKTLLKRLTNYFSHGQIAFDVMNSFAIALGNKNLKKTTGAIDILKWAVDDINEIDKLNPKLNRIEVVSRIKSIFIKKLPFGHRFILGLLSLSSSQKNAMRLLLYDF